MRAGSLIRCALFVGVAFSGGDARADALDKITGMEDWKQRDVIDMEAEWNEWHEARVSWRSSLREVELQRARNNYVAKKLGLTSSRRLRRGVKRNNAAIRAGQPRRLGEKAWPKRKPKPKRRLRPASSRRKPPSTKVDPFLAPSKKRQRNRRQKPPTPTKKREVEQQGAVEFVR